MDRHNDVMKYSSLIFVMLFFVSSGALARAVTAKKIKVLPRWSTPETEILPLLRLKADDGWAKADQTLGENAKYESKARKYKIESGKAQDDTGDLSRYLFFLTKGTQKKEPLAAEPLAQVTVLGNGEYLLLEPLTLVDTKNWEQTDLAKATGISPYFLVLRYSSKLRKLLIAQNDCAYDCPKTDKTTVWEITF